MKMTAKKFNMVEIMLAVVVIAVGMSSVFVLFPAGLNAHKSAVADNTIADFAEYVISTIKSRVDSAAEQDYTYSESGKSGNFDEFKGGLTVFTDSDSQKYKDALDIESLSNRTTLEGGSASKNDTFLLDSTGYILIRQLSGPEDDRYVDFAAVAVIKKNSLLKDFQIWKFNNAGKPGSSPEKIGDSTAGKLTKNYLSSYVLEISYPADREWNEREKKYFPFELYNTYYEVAADNWM